MRERGVSLRRRERKEMVGVVIGREGEKGTVELGIGCRWNEMLILRKWSRNLCIDFGKINPRCIRMHKRYYCANAEFSALEI